MAKAAVAKKDMKKVAVKAAKPKLALKIVKPKAALKAKETEDHQDGCRGFS